MTTGTPQNWSQADSVAFEVAVEILDELIGYAATRIDVEEGRSGTPGASGADAADDASVWRERQQSWAARRLALAPGASDVERVLAVEGDLLRRLREGAGQ